MPFLEGKLDFIRVQIHEISKLDAPFNSSSITNLAGLQEGAWSTRAFPVPPFPHCQMRTGYPSPRTRWWFIQQRARSPPQYVTMSGSSHMAEVPGGVHSCCPQMGLSQMGFALGPP